jgi:quercetin dioxygenase-like cupin family protein
MRSWDLKAIEVEAHQPEILASAEDARTILLNLPAGEELQEHEVHERARIVVIEGEVEVSMPSGESVSGKPGRLLEFEPGERHTVAARSNSRLLLILTPWPGVGHPGAMTLEAKSEARAKAAEHQRP